MTFPPGDPVIDGDPAGKANPASGSRQNIALSICIPTYNRARLLEHALARLQQQSAALDFPFEIVISDNASDDHTSDVIAQFGRHLPIRSFRQGETIPAYANYAFVMGQGAGEFITYLADDDELLLEPLARAVRDMIATPDLGMICASWFVGPPGETPAQGFFRIDSDLAWKRGAIALALNDILRWRIWPEIMIWRAALFRKLQPCERLHAYWAFANVADVLRLASISVRKEPFYHRLVRTGEPARDTIGTLETMEAWDRYRGGLEYLLGAANRQINDEQRKALAGAMTPFIGERMAAAVRMRTARNIEPQETYNLAIRARGLGFDSIVAPLMGRIAMQAALNFLVSDPRLNFGVEKLVCIGKRDESLHKLLVEMSPRPVEWQENFTPVEATGNALYFALKSAGMVDSDFEVMFRKGCKIIRESDLAAKFPL